MDPIIIGGGIGGLTLALMFHKRGQKCRVFEAVTDVRPIGVGINVLPHAIKELTELGLQIPLLDAGVETSQHSFFTRHGQKIYGEPRGVKAGYEWPQISIHRSDLHAILLEEARKRLGHDSIVLGHKCLGLEQDASGVTAYFEDSASGHSLPSQRGSVLVACDGVHSLIRKRLVPTGGQFRYSGINMWRGVTLAKPFLGGATMVHIGWYATGNMVIYPIRNNVDGNDRQLINWVASIETPEHHLRQWDRKGHLKDFAQTYDSFVFDWINIPDLLRDAELILEYPMVDQDPLDRWTEGRATLLGDAAHPMYPRGSNGAGQAVLDARTLADFIQESDDPVSALHAYEAKRRPLTSSVVMINRKNPPDAVLREVYQRTNDQPFERLDDVITDAELKAIARNYKVAAGFDAETLRRRQSQS